MALPDMRAEQSPADERACHDGCGHPGSEAGTLAIRHLHEAQALSSLSPTWTLLTIRVSTSRVLIARTSLAPSAMRSGRTTIPTTTGPLVRSVARTA